MRERELADKAKVIAVVGASPDIYRPSNTVMRYLVAAGYDVRPVRPGEAPSMVAPAWTV